MAYYARGRHHSGTIDSSEFLYYDPFYLELKERHENDRSDILALPELDRPAPTVSKEVPRASGRGIGSYLLPAPSNDYKVDFSEVHDSAECVVNELSELLRRDIFQPRTESVPSDSYVPTRSPITCSSDRDKDRVISALYDEVDSLKAQLWEAQHRSTSSSLEARLKETEEKYDIAMAVIDKMNWHTMTNS
jgi:hypothetical protein